MYKTSFLDEQTEQEEKLKMSYSSFADIAIENFQKRVEIKVKLLIEDLTLKIEEPLFFTQQLKLAMHSDLAK